LTIEISTAKRKELGNILNIPLVPDILTLNPMRLIVDSTVPEPIKLMDSSL
jgi:hypothetical protein